MWRRRMACGVAGRPTADHGLASMARRVGMAVPDGKRVGRHDMDLFGWGRPHGLMGRPAGPPRQLSARSHSLMHATRSHPVSPPVRPEAGTRAGGGGLVESIADTVGARRQARGLAKIKISAWGAWNGQKSGMPETCERQVTATRCACSRSTRTSSTCTGATPCR